MGILFTINVGTISCVEHESCILLSLRIIENGVIKIGSDHKKSSASSSLASSPWSLKSRCSQQACAKDRVVQIAFSCHSRLNRLALTKHACSGTDCTKSSKNTAVVTTGFSSCGPSAARPRRQKWHMPLLYISAEFIR